MLCQQSDENPKVRIYNRFGSITLNEREAQFSQAKLEIYGLYRTIRALCLFIIGVRNLVVETDARYIKGMLAHPDILPSASINQWILAILTFHFTLVHVKGKTHTPMDFRDDLDNPATKSKTKMMDSKIGLTPSMASCTWSNHFPAIVQGLRAVVPI
jgi:hypothetical protein